MMFPAIFLADEAGALANAASGHAAVLLLGASLIITMLLVGRWLQQEPANRPKNLSDLVFAGFTFLAALMAVSWLVFDTGTPIWSAVGLLSTAGVLAGAWVLFLPADFNEHRGSELSCDDEGLLDDARRARILIAYFESQGRISDTATPDRLGKAELDGIVKKVREVEEAAKAVPPLPISTEQEADFYLALGTLIAKARPVSVESIAHCQKAGGKRRSRVALELDTNGRFMLASVFLLVVFQAYTAIGLKLHNQVETKHRTYLSLFGAAEPLAPAVDAKPPAPDDFTLKAESKIRIAREEMTEAYASLKAWVRPVSDGLVGVGFRRDATEASKVKMPPAILERPNNEPVFPSDAAETRTQATLLLDFLSNYLLPLLYGWAGAMVYIVRRLTGEMSSLTFLPGNLAVRAWLGCIAGLAIGWFYHPTTTTTTAESITNLGPLALAFLAGFGVEIFFSMLDRFVNAFTESRSAPAGK